MKVLCAFVLVTVGVVGTPDLSAQMPAGYFRGAMPVLPDTLREVRLGGRFSIVVIRAASNAFERQLIEHAESLVPPKDSIERLARGVTAPGGISALQEASAKAGDRWWWRDWDGVLLPFALTGSAVASYIDRVRQLSVQPNPYARYNPGVEHRASVEYSARVAPSTERSGQFDVQLEVRSWFYCGGLCSVRFTHTRTVSFDATGLVLRIRGDGPPVVEVS